MPGFASCVLGLLAIVSHVAAKNVFAHFLLTNTLHYTSDDWKEDIAEAQAAHIQAFALNMAVGDVANVPGLAAAFAAASGTGFQLFFSFDYAGNGPWPKQTVIDYINQYSGNGAYFHYNGQPFVSTFEGPGNADDWTDIKAQTGCFFMPDWSSRGAKAALELNNGVADGLFSWAGWPWGDHAMDTYVDASYLQYLEGKPYMMPVSPWFFTNLPGYNKNWLWRGDDMWFDRWNEVYYIQPEFVEIQTWNDYGESHYVGPLRDNAFMAFDIGKGPFNYAENMPHDGWRLTLPFTIDQYLHNVSTISQEGLQVWFRPNPATICDDGGTTGNTASQLQIEFPPGDIVENRIFFSVLAAAKPVGLSVTVGGQSISANWTGMPDSGIGIYHGSTDDYGGATGQVVVSVNTPASTFTIKDEIGGIQSCKGPVMNWNAWTGSTPGAEVGVTTPRLDNQVCISGTGVNNFEGLCEFGCGIGYCPIGACNCKAMGTQKPKPKPTPIQAYPVSGEDPSYIGLCAFDCANGFCPPTACGTTSVPLSTPTVSDFLPPACIQGSAKPGFEKFSGLCSFSCNHGFCPMHVCNCDATGGLNDLQPSVATTGYTTDGSDDEGLCNFTCQRGYCPPPTCSETGGGDNGPNKLIPPDIWGESGPTVGCYPPCTIILPPRPLGFTTSIQWPAITTTLLSCEADGGTKTITTTISQPAFTTMAIDWWPITVSANNTASAEVTPVQRVVPPSFSITLPAGVATFPPSATDNPPTATPTCGGPVVVPIQPQPIYPLPLPATFPVYPIPFHPTPVWPDCKVGCGLGLCALFGCDHHCGLFACDGGCGIFGCDGQCSVDGGCDSGCSLEQCGPLECADGSCGEGGTGATVTACSIAPSGQAAATSCSTGAPDPTPTGSMLYEVYPQDGTDGSQTASIHATLLGLVNGNPQAIYTGTVSGSNVLFWALQLTAKQATDLSTNPSISDVLQVCTNGQCPFILASEIERQANAPWSLQYVSQYPGFEISAGGSYYYDTPDYGVPVYMVDSGADLSHHDFNQVRARARWLFINPLPGTDYEATETDSDVEGSDNGSDDGSDDGDPAPHGTCMLSQIAGYYFGVAKGCYPIIVKVGNRDPVAHYILALAKVFDDIIQQGYKRGVVNLSWAITPDEFDGDNGDHHRAQRNVMRILLNYIISEGFNVVVAAGNGGLTEIGPNGNVVAGYPAVFGSSHATPNVPGLTVVGAETGLGVRAAFSDFDDELRLPHVYGPGQAVYCARGMEDDHEMIQATSGTSMATAITAGLMATILGTAGGQALSVMDLHNYVVNYAYARGNDGSIRGIWNGITLEEIPDSCPVLPGSDMAKRDSIVGPAQPNCKPTPTTTATLPTSTVVARSNCDQSGSSASGTCHYTYLDSNHITQEDDIPCDSSSPCNSQKKMTCNVYGTPGDYSAYCF